MRLLELVARAYTLGQEHLVRAATELGVVIVDQESRVYFQLIEFQRKVSRLLGYPGGVWLSLTANQITRPLSSSIYKRTCRG